MNTLILVRINAHPPSHLVTSLQEASAELLYVFENPDPTVDRTRLLQKILATAQAIRELEHPHEYAPSQRWEICHYLSMWAPALVSSHS